MAGLSLGNILSAVKLAITLSVIAALLWYRHDAQRWHLAFDKIKAEYVAASQMAVWKQIASNNAIQARYSAIAEETHADYTQRLARAHSASDGFMRANRACPSSGTATAGQGADSSVHEGTAASPILVSPADVKACTAAAVYSQSAHEWTKALIAEGLGE